VWRRLFCPTYGFRSGLGKNSIASFFFDSDSKHRASVPFAGTDPSSFNRPEVIAKYIPATMKLVKIAIFFAALVPIVQGRLFMKHRKLILHERQDMVVVESYVLVFNDDVKDANAAAEALFRDIPKLKKAKITVLNKAIRG